MAAVVAGQMSMPTRATSKRFSKTEIVRYIELAGIKVAADANVSVITPFFQGLEEDKGNKLRSRLYFEQKLKTAPSTDPVVQMEMTTIFST